MEATEGANDISARLSSHGIVANPVPTYSDMRRIAASEAVKRSFRDS